MEALYYRYFNSMNSCQWNCWSSLYLNSKYNISFTNFRRNDHYLGIKQQGQISMPDDPKRFAVAMTEYSKEKVLTFAIRDYLIIVIYLFKAITINRALENHRTWLTESIASVTMSDKRFGTLYHCFWSFRYLDQS